MCYLRDIIIINDKLCKHTFLIIKFKKAAAKNVFKA